MVSILVDTNPYSLEKRKYEEVSGSGHAAYASSIRARILSESNFFRGMEYPMSGHVIETQRVNTCKRPYFLDLPRIMECRWWTLQLLPLIFTKIWRYGLCYPNIYSKRSRNVKILIRRMRWNSTIREVSGVFTCPKFHGRWDSKTTQKPLEFHGSWNYRCWNCGKTPWYAKIATPLLY